MKPLKIKFKDDGHGLNLAAIYKSALKKGLISETDPINSEYVANLIFTSQFSTAKKVSDISGRGIGMNAVRSFLEDENCSIEIRVFDPSVNELDFSPFEFIITMPPRFFQFMGELEV